MGAFSYSGTAASNTTVDGIGAAGSDSPDNIDNLVRALAASDANLVRDLGGANTVAGTADAITVALADASTASYFDGMIFSFRAGSDTTITNPTLNVDSLGAKTIKKTIAGIESPLTIGDIQAGGTYHVVYRSAWASAAGAFELLNPFTSNDSPLRGYIHGLTLSNNGSDATNDIDIAAGECTSDAFPYVRMALTSTLTKRLDAAWAVGTGNGGLDTGSIANTTYHIWLIQRSDTGVVDALFSTSATSPTMPTNYDRKRRIGSIIRASAAIRAFVQDGDRFYWNFSPTPTDYSGGTRVQSALTVTVPSGIRVEAIVQMEANTNNAASASVLFTLYDGANTTIEKTYQASHSATGVTVWKLVGSQMTNTSAQIQLYITGSNVATSYLYTRGWIDTRGKDA